MHFFFFFYISESHDESQRRTVSGLDQLCIKGPMNDFYIVLDRLLSYGVCWKSSQ